MDVLAAMRVFVRVVERGSMSAAARDLGLGQPSVSERIERLEAHIGASLLRRSTRQMSLTDVGAAFYERSRQTLAAADDAMAVAATDRRLRGTLRIAAPHGVGDVVLPPILLALRDRYPDLAIDLVLNDRIVDPVTEGVDLSLRLGKVGDGSFVARPLGQVRRVLVAAPNHLDRGGIPMRPSDLVEHPFLRVAGLFNNELLPLAAEGGRFEQAPIRIVFSASHWQPLRALLIGGAGIGVLQAPVCADDLAAGRLTRVLPGFAVPGLDLHALYQAGRPLCPKLAAAVRLLDHHLPRILG